MSKEPMITFQFMNTLSFKFNFRLDLFHALFLCVLVNFSCQSQHIEEFSMDLTQDIVTPKMYTINPAGEKLIIDGISNEASWARAEWTDDFIDIEGEKIPKHKTRLKMLWDDHYLYIYAQMEEPHVAANITQHDTVIFYDKDFEVFIDHNDDTYQYVELEINALNTTWDLYLDRPYRSKGVALDEYEMQGLKHAIHVNGTLNDATDIDKSWSIELAIPFEAILKRKNNGVKTGDYWRMNFSRVHWDQEFEDGKYRRQRDENNKLNAAYNWVWSNQGVINMHLPEMWGYAFFADADELDFDLPNDYCDQQVAYACYRKFRHKPWKQLKKNKTGFSKIFDILGCDNQDYSATFIKTNMGFELLIENKNAQRSYVIDQGGRLKKL